MIDFKLFKHQQECFDRAKDMNNYALLFDQGCLSGDTIIKVNRGKASRKYTFRKLYSAFNSLKLYPRDRGFDNSIPTRVRSFDGERIRLHTINAVTFSGFKECYRILLTNGKHIDCTEDHKILTNKGYVEAIKLKSQNYLVMCDDLVKHQKNGNGRTVSKRYRSLHVGYFHPYARTIIAYGKKRKVLDTHKIVYEADLNNLSVEEFINATKVKNNLKYINPKTHHIHHKDGDTFNNDITNLECMLAKDHQALSGGYAKFLHGIPSFHKVKAIFPIGKIDTYDISCDDPHHNFVANDIVVHNSGKTLTTIMLLRHKWNTHKRRMKTLILCPSQVVYNWKDEILKFSNIPKDSIHVLRGGSAKITKDLGNIKDGIVITNIDQFSRDIVPAAIKGWGPEILILDESHMAKTPTSKRSKNIYSIATRATYRYILTGTPILNSPMDIFQQYKILDLGKTFGTNFFIFRSTYFYDKNARWSGKQGYFPDWRPIESMFPVLTEKIYSIGMRVLKSECLDLPPITYQNIEVELTKEQRSLYNQFAKNYIAFIEEMGEIKASNASIALVRALRFQQIVSGHITLDTGEIKDIDCSTRKNALINCLENILPNKVIIWYNFKKDFDIIKNILEDLKATYVYANGDCSLEEKQKAINDFQNDKSISVFVCNRALGTGMNLTEAAYDITWSRNYNQAHNLQSHDRNYRIGSEKHKNITKINIYAKNTVDENITEALASKKKLSDVIIDIVKKLKEEK